ncbi:MAG: dihydroorotase [Acidobacteriota bacterium]
MSKILLKGGLVVDPASDREGKADVLIRSGRIAKIGRAIKETGVRTLDCKGKVVCPGFIDMHVRLGEPGREELDTITSGGRAAVAGGFTALAVLPGTDPVNDDAETTMALRRRAEAEAACRIHPIAALTRGREGKQLTEMGHLREAGAVAVSDADRPVTDAGILRQALDHAGMFALPVIDFPEDPSLTAGGQVHEGWVSTRLGMPGLPAVAEEHVVARDVMLSALTGSHLHLALVSTATSVDLVRQGKRGGEVVSCAVSPHHLLLEDEACATFDTNCKVRPPLRSAQDRKALLRGVKDGTVDCITSAHRPRHVDEKDVPFPEAEFGIAGLESTVPLVLDLLCSRSVIDLPRLVSLMSWNPARILGLRGGTLAVGAPADVTILDLEATTTVDPDSWLSLSRNTPLAGRELKGAVAATVVDGRVVWTRESGLARGA